MNKRFSLFIVFVIVGILVSLPFCSAVTFGVSIGDTFTYDCIVAERSIVLGSESSDSEGYMLGDHRFAAGSSVDVEVTNIFSDSVFYEVSKDGYSTYTHSDARSLVLSIRFRYGLFILSMRSYVFSTPWNQTLMDEAPGVPIDMLFIETDSSTWANLEDMVESMMELFSTYESPSALVIDASYTDDDSIFTCHFHLSGIYNETHTPFTTPASPYSDYSDDVDCHYKFAYEKATGILLGMHIYGSMTGTANGTDYELSINSRLEKEGFDFSEASSGITNLFPGFTIAISLGSITTIFMLATILRRKKYPV